MSRALLLLVVLLSVGTAMADTNPVLQLVATSRYRFQKGRENINLKTLSNKTLSNKRIPFSSSSSALALRGGASPNTGTSGVDSFLYAMDLVGTAVFAFSGALTAGKKGMDILGMLIIATITSVGGGTLRDLLLGSGTAFWMKEAIYVQICVVTTILTYLLWPTLEEKLGWKGSEGPVCTADAVGLAAFAVLGTQKAARSTEMLHPSMWIVSGLMSSCFGGIIRDMMCLQRPRVMYPERTMYATAPLVGSTVYTGLTIYCSGMETHTIATISFLATFLTRVGAFNNPIRMPHWKKSD